MLEVFIKGGWMMYPLALSSIIALAVVIERLWALRRKRILNPEIISVLEQIRREEDLSMVSSVCQKLDGPFSRVVQSCIANRDLEPEELRVYIEDEGRQEVRDLERGLGTLETVAGVAPLMGLLGTVLGMIKVFNIIQTLGVGQAKALSGGISEALITTATGLIIGIPTLVAYHYFSYRSQNLILDMEKYVLTLLNKLVRFQRGKEAGSEKIENVSFKEK